MPNKHPRNAILAVTLNCNSHCVMCDIWKNKIENELPPEIYNKLPNTLTDINISGGEPFLRSDLSLIIKILKNKNPKAKIIINTNGFLTNIIDQQLKDIIAADPKIGIRVSIDGWQSTHDQVRGTKNAFNKAIKTISILKKHNLKNIGISFTIMDSNYSDLPKIYDFCNQENLQLSLTLASDSPIYFGDKKSNLQPKNSKDFEATIKKIYTQNYLSFNPKKNFRAWFEEELFNYYKNKTRKYSCNAGQDFFYLDSVGNVYTCHLQNYLLGNLKDNSFSNIWKNNKKFINKINKCHNCWMICNAKTTISKNIIPISQQIIKRKIQCLLK